MGADGCRGLVRVDGLRDFGGDRNYSSSENAADRAVGNLLQSAVAYSCGVSTVVEWHVGWFAGGRHHVGILVGNIADRGCALGIRVRELYLSTETSRSCSLNRALSLIGKT